MIDRRAALSGLLLAPFAVRAAWAAPAMVVFKDPDCGCCGAWVEHVRAAGIKADVRTDERMNEVKARFGVPAALASCHTALIDNFLVEGHVPAETILRLLRERPALAGIAVPGMPIGSPGMEVPGQAPDPFDVVGFTRSGKRSVFARYPRGFTPG